MGSSQKQVRRNISTLVMIGAGWFIITRWVLRLIGLVSTVVLARLLVPADFGIAAICMSIFSILDTTTDFGLRTAVIRRENVDMDFIDSVFTLQILRGVLLASLVALLSAVIPLIIGDARLGSPILVISFIPLIAGLSNSRLALFEKELNFRRESAIQITAKTSGTITSIIWAMITRSYWSLIAGIVVNCVVKVVMSYALATGIPRIRTKGIRDLLNFSGWLSGSYMLDAIGKGFDSILVGSLINVTTSGVYNVGQQLAEMPLSEFVPAINRALFPGLVKFRDASEQFKANAIDAMEILASLSLPIGIGFSFVAPELVRLLYGAKWEATIPVVQALSISYAIETIGASVASSVGMATAQTRLLFNRSFFRTLLRVPIFAIGAWLFGIPGAILGSVLGSLIWMVFSLGLLHTLLHTTYAEIARRLCSPVFSVIVMSILLTGFKHLTSHNNNPVHDILDVLLTVLIGIASYTIAWLFIYKTVGVSNSLEARILDLQRVFYKRVGL